jgi:cell division protein FtsL
MRQECSNAEESSKNDRGASSTRTVSILLGIVIVAVIALFLAVTWAILSGNTHMLVEHTDIVEMDCHIEEGRLIAKDSKGEVRHNIDLSEVIEIWDDLIVTDNDMYNRYERLRRYGKYGKLYRINEKTRDMVVEYVKETFGDQWYGFVEKRKGIITKENS